MTLTIANCLVTLFMGVWWSSRGFSNVLVKVTFIALFIANFLHLLTVIGYVIKHS